MKLLSNIFKCHMAFSLLETVFEFWSIWTQTPKLSTDKNQQLCNQHHKSPFKVILSTFSQLSKCDSKKMYCHKSVTRSFVKSNSCNCVSSQEELTPLKSMIVANFFQLPNIWTFEFMLIFTLYQLMKLILEHYPVTKNAIITKYSIKVRTPIIETLCIRVFNRIENSAKHFILNQL